MAKKNKLTISQVKQEMMWGLVNKITGELQGLSYTRAAARADKQANERIVKVIVKATAFTR